MLRLDTTRYRVMPHSNFQLAQIHSADTQGLHDKHAAQAQLRENRCHIADLQERLYAEEKQSLLVVLQAMDAGGKDSTLKAVTKGLNPQGCHVASFKAPSKQELAHDFLWRIHAQVPAKGHMTFFNRSHYEDVLIVRVKGLAPLDLVEKRYRHINDFEQMLMDHGTRIIKVLLHISPEYQLQRFQRRLEDQTKHWKFNPADLTERARWTDYMAAFEVALNRCSTEFAPWYVIPAEKKWFRTLAVSQVVLDTLQDMNPQYPAPDFDLAAYPPDSLV